MTSPTGAPPTSRTPASSPAHEVAADQVDLVAEEPEERPRRHVLGERHRVPLDVGVARPVGRVPDDPVLLSFGPAPRRRRRPGSARRSPAAAGRSDGAASALRVRVDVGAVLRPDHQVRLRLRRRPPRAAASSRVRCDVVVQHGAALGVEVQAEPRHVALDHRDGRRRAAGGQRRPGQRQPGQGADQRDGEHGGHGAAAARSAGPRASGRRRCARPAAGPGPPRPAARR